MKSTFVAAATAVFAGLASAVDLPTGWFSIAPDDEIQPGDLKGKPRYLTWMADSQIKHGVEPTHAYTISSFYSGVMLAYERTGDQKYLDYSVADAVVAAQDEKTKGWYLVMDPGLENEWGNYIESSGSAMFVYGLLKGLR
ncbi:hypothetical protein BN1723_015773, partial [Verticillium longisporum]